MTNIQLHTHGQTLFQISDAIIAAGDCQTVRLLIETDPEWIGLDLYALLWRDGRQDLALSVPLCESGCCMIPALLLAEAGTLHIALMGLDTAGHIKTSTAIRYQIRPGAPGKQNVILANVSDANATPDSVLAGVTFYAGNGEIRMGAMPTYTEGEIVSDEVVDQLTVMADFSDGDQVITAEGNAPMRSVTVQKPDNLMAAYIARGIRIAGVEGTLPALPEVSREDNGKLLSVVDGTWSAIPPMSDNGIPFFDLVALGLPTVNTDGTTSDLTIDTADIRNALDQGAVKFILNISGAGTVEVVMTQYATNGLYICTYTALHLTLTLMIAENAIQASATTVSNTKIYNGEVEVV